jgi:Uma2 family endonuclease
VASNPVSKLTEEQYLAFERAAEYKSEFLDGEMLAMSGASRSHVRIQQNLAGELYARLRGSGCEALGSDIRIRVSSRNYFYADVSVACDKVANEGDDNLTNPVVIFEISSPSTARYDRDLKFQRYQDIDSLKDYILVKQERVHIEHFTRQEDGGWRIRYYPLMGDDVQIDSIGVAIPVSRIYERVNIPPTD